MESVIKAVQSQSGFWIPKKISQCFAKNAKKLTFFFVTRFLTFLCVRVRNGPNKVGPPHHHPGMV